MSGKDTQVKIVQKIRTLCESESNYQKHSPYLIDKAQSGDQFLAFFKIKANFNFQKSFCCIDHRYY